ncbi:MAG TPA: chitobiase/beta-hexosaminidase C-terminal domain-containing protein, partial [Rubrobacteraceae bacterium]|nr:chitobiase/beta-hexosaminidase C-terminal domain-containing protein [Rubrobacteraceae bacterium]
MFTSYTGSTKRKQSGLGVAFLALLAALLVALTLAPRVQAQAADPIVPPDSPKAPVVFPERDFVVAEGYDPGPLTFRIERDGVLIGRAEGTVGADGLLEVNHPGGICWGKLQPDNPDSKAVTPDILPGDIVKFDSNGVVDRIRTLDVTAEAATRDENGTPSDTSDDKLVVHGTARDELGNPMSIDKIEQRIINPDFVDTEVGRRDISVVTGPGGARVPAGADATLVQDGANWTATYTGLSSNVIDLAIAGQTRVLSWMDTNAAGDRLGITIYEVGELGGPGFGGCPLNANYKVKSSSPKFVNADFQGGNGPLVLSGLAHNASSVTVTLDDNNDATPALTQTTTNLTPDPDNPDEQTWSAEFAKGDVLGLDAGTLTAKARFTIPNPEPAADGTSPATVEIGGAKLEILKDLDKPLAPTADVGSGTYNTTQFVKLSNDPAANNPDPSAEVHYTVNGSTPTADSRVFRLPIRIASDQTIK